MGSDFFLTAGVPKRNLRKIFSLYCAELAGML